MSSGCNMEVSPQGCVVELGAMKVRFVYLTKKLILHFGRPKTWSQSKPYVGQLCRGRKGCLPVAFLTTDNLP